jgi:hypothetical protein
MTELSWMLSFAGCSCQKKEADVSAKVLQGRKSTAVVRLGTAVAILGIALMPARSSAQTPGPPTKVESARTAFPNLTLAELKWSDAIAAVSAFGAIIGFFWGIRIYFASERWKRSEFVAAQIKEFHSDKINESVLRMMDYDPARVDLFPHKPNEARYVDVSLTAFVNAIAKEEYDTDEAFQIRQYFEHFLTSLSRLNYFIDSGAIKPKELCADFRYIVSLMDETDPMARKMKKDNTGVDMTSFSNAVNDYLTRWGDKDIKDFIKQIRRSCK